MSVTTSSLRNKASHSLRFKIIATLILCATALSLLSISFIFVSQHRHHRQELAQNGDIIANRLAFTMAQPLWNFDKPYLQQLADQELESPLVVSVFVSSNDKSLSMGRRKVSGAKDGAQFESFSTHLEAAASECITRRPSPMGPTA